MPVKSKGYQDFSGLRVADAAAKSATPPVDTATGISFTIPGGATTTDPGDGIWASWPLFDIIGRRCRAGTVQPYDLFEAMLYLQEVTAPSLTSDSWVGIGISNRAEIDGAVNAYFGAIKYASSVRGARAGGISAGTASITDDASPDGAMRQIQVDSAYSFGGQFGTVFVTGLTAGGLNIFGNFDTASRGVNASMVVAPADPHVFIAAGRTAATAGEVTLVARPLYQALAFGKIPTF